MIISVVAVQLRSRGLLMLDVAHTKEPFTPLSASSSGGTQWQPVSVVQDRVSIKGGYNTRGEAAPTIHYQVGDTTQVFVELDKNVPWFLKGVGGPRTQKGYLKAVEVMQLLRARFSEKLEGEPDDNAAVAEGQISADAATQSESQETDEYIDPMDAMDAMDEVAAVVAEVVPQKKAPKPKRRTQDTRRSLVLELEVPTRPRCAGCGKDDKTVICVYRKPNSDKRTNSNLYLRMDCIEWLLAYAADELAFQGVEPASPAPTPHQAGNCPAVADLHLEWDFSAKAWEGKFVAGPSVGTTKRMSVKDLDKHKWEKLEHESVVQGYLSNATPRERKNAVKEWMTMWCAAIARNESAEFDAIMGSLAASSTPHGEKRPLEDYHHTAVAAKEVCLAAADADTAVAASPLDEDDALSD